MDKIYYIDRKSQKKECEVVYGGAFLFLLYGDSFLSKIFSVILTPLIVKIPFFSKMYGVLQNRKKSRKKVRPFIERFHVDASEFEKKIDEFSSFNDFFYRKLKPSARPLIKNPNVAALPADGRYLFFKNINHFDEFYIKGKKFALESFLQSKTLAKQYENGSMVIARLCPTDYHRFHFPINCVPNEPRLINGDLYSVNPIALRKRLEILVENKRYLTLLQSDLFKEVAFVEIGATFVGSVFPSFTPHIPYKKGDEKGYFAFGASMIVLLFQKGVIEFDADLIEATSKKIEIKALVGQSMGTSKLSEQKNK